MSKGSMFWNLARGKVGSIVISVNKGQVITRQYQPNVSNPRTRPQILQRAKFANCVEFYKRATSNFFRFAYEDKRQNESDYNAFMRHNVTSNVGLLKYDQTKGNFPAIASQWVLTSGSLAEVSLLDVRTAKPYLSIPTGNYTAQTIGALSQSLVDSYNLAAGDIVTIVRVTSPVTALTSPIPQNPPKWELAQFVVKTTDGTPLENVMQGISLESGKGLILDSAARDYFALYGVVFSRKTSSGLTVSTSILEPNAVAYDLYSKTRDTAWQTECYTSWNAAGEAVLEGSLVSSTSSAVIETVSGSDVPRISPTVLGSGVSSTAVITGSGLESLTIDQFSGYGCTVSALDIRDDQSASITITGTGEHPNSWILYFNSVVIARHQGAEATVSSVSPASVDSLGNGDTAELTVSGTNVDVLKASDFTLSDSHLTISRVTYVSANEIRLTLNANAEVTSATMLYKGSVIFEIAEVVPTITSSAKTIENAGTNTVHIEGTGLGSLTAGSFTIENGSVTSYTAAPDGNSADIVISANTGGNGSLKYRDTTLATWEFGPDFG